jgi:hypothetical protein
VIRVFGRHYELPPLNRLRGRVLEQLMAGRSAYTAMDLGGCCCGSTPPGLTCGTCVIPGTPLTVTDSVYFPGGLSATFFPDLSTLLPFYVSGGHGLSRYRNAS